MAKSRKFTVVAASDGSQVGTHYTPWVSGYIESVQYVKADSGGYTDGVDFTITKEATGETVWAESNVNATKRCYPRAATHSTAGVAALFAAGGTAVSEPICLGGDRLKLVVASGGNAKTGAFHVTIRD